jgi:16S rRNA (cytosine1402-N4)-methyltransferase
MLDEVLAVLNPRPDQVAVDCTCGFAGHAVELLRRLGPGGKLVGIDFDADHLPRCRERLAEVGHPFALHHGNFAGLTGILAAEGLTGCDMVLADLGMSSLQLDDAARGFSYVREGPLDMRMDRSRGRPASAVLQTIDQEELAEALKLYGDEPQAECIAAAIVAARARGPLESTSALREVIVEAVSGGKPGPGWRLHPRPGQWQTHPAARTFQALRIMVNRELANLEALLRQLPGVLRPGGMAAIISFHSGEDRLVKSAWRAGRLTGIYSAGSDDVIRPNFQERQANPRSRSAKMRWVKRA